MPLQIVRSHAREHKRRRVRQANLSEVLAFITQANRREMRTIRIAMEQCSIFFARKEANHG